MKKLNWIATLLVSIFVGKLGVDRFMMGQTGLGLLKLFTFGGFGIWWLIDVIRIAKKSNFDYRIQWVD